VQSNSSHPIGPLPAHEVVARARASVSSHQHTCHLHISSPANASGNIVRMAQGQKLYPRATVKKIVKAHSNCSVSKNVDVLVGDSGSRQRSALWRRVLIGQP